jgi:hypothetical protein
MSKPTETLSPSVEKETILDKLVEIQKNDLEAPEINSDASPCDELLEELNKRFEPFADPSAQPDKLIGEWLSDEGYEVEGDKRHHREKYRFYAERNTEKFQRQYIVEVKDYGKSISKLKLLILSVNRDM